MIWARVALGRAVASKMGGISFNLVCVCVYVCVSVCVIFLLTAHVHGHTGSLASVLLRTLICLLTPVMEPVPAYRDAGPPNLRGSPGVLHITICIFYMLHQWL